jgi:hypothetical protein
LLLLGLAGTWSLPAAAQSSSFPARSSARVVFVGHSLINYQMPLYFKQIASSKSVSLESAVQVNNGTPLKGNWEGCRKAQFSGQYPPRSFACDAIDAGSASGPYDTLIATDANNSIQSNRIYNAADKYLELFMNLLLAKNPSARTFAYTTWESLNFVYASGSWIDNQAADLAQYQLIASQAQKRSADRGQNGKVDVIPMDIALRDLVLKAERGEIPGITSRSQIFKDDNHMNELGNYYVACVVFAAVYNQTPAGATTNMTGEYGGTELSVSGQTASALQSLAWQTIVNYRAGTTTNPPPAAKSPKAPQNLKVQ